MKKLKKRIKFMQWIGVVTIIIAFILVVYGAIALVYPYKTLEITSDVKVLNSPVTRGDVLYYRFERCKYTDKPITLSKELANGYHIAYTPISTTADKGCTNITSSVVIPDYTPAGHYILRLVATSRINSLREISVSFQTEEIVVIK